MFPLRKLGELSPRTRLRKVARILQAVEVELAGAGAADFGYLRDLARLLTGDEADFIRQDAVSLLNEASADGMNLARVLRCLNVLRNDILHELQAEPAEWDLINPSSGLLSRKGVSVLPLRVYLEDVRSPFNVGSIFRTAEAFGAEKVLLSPRTPLPTHPRASKAAMKAQEAMPWAVVRARNPPGNRRSLCPGAWRDAS